MTERRPPGPGPSPLTPRPPLPQGERGGATGADDLQRWNVPPGVSERMREVAREFRKQPTPSELSLWHALRDRGVDGLKFRRQQPIGPFAVDFFCAAERLIVEVDGGVHESQRERDRERQTLIESLGLRFVRIPARLVEQDLPTALGKIREAVRSSPPLPSWERGPGGEGREGPGERGATPRAHPSAIPAPAESFESARGDVPPDQPEVAESHTPVGDHAPSHAGEPVPAEDVAWKEAEEFRPLNVIGRRQRKTDGLSKSTGGARYTDDITLPGMLHGKILRSPHPHARILAIDTSAAERLPGVFATVTGAEMPTPYGIIVWTPDEQALATNKVRYIGDAVAAVAALDEDTANHALELIRVEYEVLDAILDPEESARRTDIQIHEPKGKPVGQTPKERGSEGTEPKAKNGNISKIVKLEFGDVDAAMRTSDVVIEGEYFFEGTTHTPIEPHCAIGMWEEGGAPAGRLTVWSSTPVPHYLHRELAKVLELDPAKVRVIQPPVGGGFGGKSEPFDLEFCVAKLAMKTGRPVKILYTREEVFYAHRGRHPFLMKYRVGATVDGKLKAVDAKTLLDGGAYSSFGLVTTYYSGQLLTAPYEMPTYRFDSTRVFTNKPACGPKRGHGSVQPRFAFEVTLDKLAERLSLDPIEIRRRNFMGAYRRTVNELRVTSNGFLECLDAVEHASEWKHKFRQMGFGRGVGVAGSCYISGTNYPIYPNRMPQSAVQLQVDRSGRVAIFSGASDIGQGSDSMVAYVVCEELGVPLDYVRVLASDTDLTPVDLGAYSSRVTFMLGNACIDAARKLKALVQDAVGAEWGISPKRVLLAGGRAMDARDTGRNIPIREAFNLAEAKHGTLGSTGWYNTPKDVHGEYRGGTIGASPAYSFTAHVAEVEVDVETGFVEVKTIWVAHDCGRALNPVIVEGQMEGSAYMGFGEALMEEHIFKDADHGRAGLHNGPSLLDYRIPTSLDTPELRSLIIESIDPEGPYGAKEAGEGPLHPSIPAIANAIYDAVGVRMDALPFSAPRVWRALQEKAGEVRIEEREAAD
ncbi:xanthine dehydrogenase family protein molybdopterin-binding subunit [soil metagenome]